MVDAPAQKRAELLRLVLVTYVAVAALVTAAVLLLNVELPVVGNVGGAIVAVVFLYAPVVVGWRRHEDLSVYGFTTVPLRRSLITAGIYVGVVGPLFVGGYILFHQVVCDAPSLERLLHRAGQCVRFDGWAGLHAPALTLDFLQEAAIQLIVVALPEELFFRGFCLEMLERAFPPKRRILGGGVGLALVISAAMFALVHLPRQGVVNGLATFFPGLVFGWMRSSTRSILAGTVAHASSNMLVKLTEALVLR